MRNISERADDGAAANRNRTADDSVRENRNLVANRRNAAAMRANRHSGIDREILADPCRVQVARTMHDAQAAADLGVGVRVDSVLELIVPIDRIDENRQETAMPPAPLQCAQPDIIGKALAPRDKVPLEPACQRRLPNPRQIRPNVLKHAFSIP